MEGMGSESSHARLTSAMSAACLEMHSAWSAAGAARLPITHGMSTNKPHHSGLLRKRDRTDKGMI